MAPAPPVTIGGVVLCGGESRRMGTSKAWLECEGEYLLGRVVRIVAEVASPVVVAATGRGQELPPLPPEIEICHDAPGVAGPLAGVASGFEALAGRCEAAFVVSCDCALLKPAFILRLADLLGDRQAVVCRHDGRLHPTTALYRLTTRETLCDLLAARCFRATTFAQRCSPLIARVADFADCDPELESLRNFNDPAAYQALQEKLAARRQRQE